MVAAVYKPKRPVLHSNQAAMLRLQKAPCLWGKMVSATDCAPAAVHLPVACPVRVAFHWDNLHVSQQLVIRPCAPGWPWSGAFHLPDKEAYFGLRLRNRCDQYLACRLTGLAVYMAQQEGVFMPSTIATAIALLMLSGAAAPVAVRKPLTFVLPEQRV